MLKLAGILFIVAGAGGYGRYLGFYLKLHVRQLSWFREIFARMDAGRNYLRLPYAQLLRRTAGDREEMFSDMLFEIADAMEENREADAGALWEAAFLKRKKDILLNEEERDLMLALARSLMMEGDHAQVAKLYFMQLDDAIKKAMEEKKEKQKLYGTVGVLGGVFLSILLL